MDLPGLLSVEEASERLGRSPQAVRLMAVSGEIDAVKLGHAWLLDARSVDQRRREPPGHGRPLSPAMAWSVLRLASGVDEPVAWPADKPHHPSRARRWLREHRLEEEFTRLRSRATRERHAAHPAELRRILTREDVVATGISAASAVGLHGGPPAAEFYAAVSTRAAIVGEHGLEAGSGAVLARWVPDDVWPAVAGDRAPRAAILIDLLEHDDPRARREAARALSER